jgi:hypothetical protein
MADLSITVASLATATNTVKDVSKNAGEAVAQGKAVYFDSTLQQWLLADSNHATAAKRRATGIALNTTTAAGQPIAVATGGDLTLGATLTAGSRYYVSGTAGGICPEADLTTGMEVSLIGIAKSATLLGLSFINSQVTL